MSDAHLGLSRTRGDKIVIVALVLAKHPLEPSNLLRTVEDGRNMRVRLLTMLSPAEDKPSRDRIE